MPFTGFQIGKRYRLHEDMWKASKGFGVYIGGIAPKGRYPNTEAVVILATVGEGARYGDRWDGDVLVFSGEDRRGIPDGRSVDQSPEMGGNRVLTHSRELEIPIYAFWAKQTDLTWEYLGLAQVDDWALERRGGRKVVEYRISLLGVPNRSAQVALRKRLENEMTRPGPPSLKAPEGRGLETAPRRARSGVFSDLVKSAYANRCSVCGVERRNVRGRPEVEAAHIYPVELEGADDVRNGISLCRLHHWAFDGAILGIDPTRTIKIFGAGLRTPGVAEFAGRPLVALPTDVHSQPHELYLRERYRLSRKGWTRGRNPDE